MQMPVMDGLALTRAIKADAALADIHLVLLTSLGQRGDASQMKELGIAACLTKPTRQSDLFDSLASVLAGQQVRPMLRPLVPSLPKPVRRRAVRILLVEDNIVNQQVAVGILKKLGLRADAVADGQEALKALETLPYDVVLMDVQMPVMDGLEATRRIRDPKSAVLDHHIPIIAMTANAMQGDREKCLMTGMDDYVPKPVSPKALTAVLEKWLPRDSENMSPPDSREKSRQSPPISPQEWGAVVFDKAGMLSRLMGDEDLATTVVTVFLDDMPLQIEALRACFSNQDTDSAMRQLHSMKSAAAHVGGEVLCAVALEMEKACKARALASAIALLPQLESQFKLLKATVSQTFFHR
jgi:CheY-like chemotaxis protein/HPt (histidine-containing phosphotransfer) domain-containing protein